MVKHRFAVLAVAAPLIGAATFGVVEGVQSTQADAGAGGTAPPQVLLNAFSLLRSSPAVTPSTSQGAIGPSTSQGATGPSLLQPELATQLGVNLASAVPVPNTPYPTWVLPGAANTCVTTVGIVGPNLPSSVCATNGQVLNGGLVQSAGTPTGTMWVIGVAPDDDATVQVTRADGSTITVPVTDNVYEVQSSVSSVTVGGATGVPDTSAF